MGKKWGMGVVCWATLAIGLFGISFPREVEARPLCSACEAGACKVSSVRVEEDTVACVAGRIVFRKAKLDTACENCLSNCIDHPSSGGDGFGSALDQVCVDKFCEPCANGTFCHPSTPAPETAVARQDAIKKHSRYASALQKCSAPCGGCNNPCPK